MKLTGSLLLSLFMAGMLTMNVSAKGHKKNPCYGDCAKQKRTCYQEARKLKGQKRNAKYRACKKENVACKKACRVVKKEKTSAQ